MRNLHVAFCVPSRNVADMAICPRSHKPPWHVAGAAPHISSRLIDKHQYRSCDTTAQCGLHGANWQPPKQQHICAIVSPAAET